MSFLFTFTYPRHHPSFSPITPSDRRALQALTTTADNGVDNAVELGQLTPHEEINGIQEDPAAIPPIQRPPTFRRHGCKLFLYKAVLVTVNLSVVISLVFFFDHNWNSWPNDKPLFGWIPRVYLLLLLQLSAGFTELVLIFGLLFESPALVKLNALKCAVYSLAALYLLTTVQNFVERTWPLCCDLLLFPVAGHISLLFVLELNRQKLGEKAWKGYIREHVEQRRLQLRERMLFQQQFPRRPAQFDEVSL